ncbi:MAG: metalloregulator ArsR/SmtB family transcription factor [Saprospiraceae bacterium]|nr:metalloregulator ArsR/SmtB family transcription factor [Saprospiraceae bacterium]
MAFSKAASFGEIDVELAALAKALSHPARLVILRFLVKQSGCICSDIVAELPLSQSTVSQHLKVLRDVDLIKGDIDGPKICYCINQEKIERCFAQMRQLFTNLNCC